jgi:NAD+ kinase
MIFYFFGKQLAKSKSLLLLPVFERLVSIGHQIVVNDQLKLAFVSNSSFNSLFTDDLELDISIVDIGVSIGGDGTLLEFLTHIKDYRIPILAVNAGRLGFLATTSITESDKIVKELLKPNKDFQPRNLISLQTEDNIFGELNFALNEFAITKRDTSSMITIHVYIDDQFLNSYWADGLLVSTPTGSTGYSLSAGGPLVMPQTNNFVVTPLNPHSLTVRPIIVPDSSKIRLIVEGRTKKVLLSLDHRSASLNTGVDMVLERSHFPIKLIKTEDYNYFNTLRSRLNWGSDVRN